MSANAALRIAMLYLTLEMGIGGARVANQATTCSRNWGQKQAFGMGDLTGWPIAEGEAGVEFPAIRS
jgi:hypothetical protein